MTAPRATKAVKPHAVDAIIDANEAYQAARQVRQAPAWMPEPGTTVRAKVIGLKMGTSDFGAYPIIVYREWDGNEYNGKTFSVHAFHTVLRERLAELKTDIDAEQFLTYEGERTSRSRVDKDGNPQNYHSYDVDTLENVLKLAQVGNVGKDENFAF